uniref:COMM domain containing 9 n=1 Tax=Oryzias sinensis TaxID=183150 RepID=A0A8C7Z200_9TELE
MSLCTCRARPLTQGYQAPSKDVVREVCIQSHSGPSRRLTDNTAAALSISAAQALVQSLHTLSHHILFYNLSSPEQILSIFPETFHSSLKNLITKILLENRVDLVTGSDKVSRMSMPTCLVQLKLEDPCQSTNMESDSTMTVELSKESLDTMLDGLGRIRDQLSVVAGK